MATWRSLFVENISDYFGYVNSIEDANHLINVFFVSTTSRFVVAKVEGKLFGNTDFKTKPHKLQWECEATKSRPAIPYDGIPFMRVNMKVLNCQFGMDKSLSNKRKFRAKRELEEANGLVKMTRSAVFCKKRNCPANIVLIEVIKFPDFNVDVDSTKSRRYVSQNFFTAIKQDDVTSLRRIYISFPERGAHQFHPLMNEKFLRLPAPKQPGMLAALSSSTGRVEDINVKQISLLTPGENEVLITVYASALNREDIDQRVISSAVNSRQTHVLGYEAAGTVSNIPSSGSKWSIGDRVMAYLPNGGCAEQVLAHQDHVMLVPDAIALSSAAAIPQVWLTAYHLLYHVGNLKQGDIVLIHAGASGVGTALIQLVNMAGGYAIVTASSTIKIDLCKSLGAVAGFCYKSRTCVHEIANYLEGKGVDLILDCVAGTHWEMNTQLIRTHGTWIIYGLLSGPFVAGDMRPLLKKNITLQTSVLRTQSEQYISNLVTSFTEKVLQYFQPNAEFELNPVINRFFALEQISEAHKFLESNHSIGKVIISIKEEDREDIEQRQRELIEVAETIQVLAEGSKEIIVELNTNNEYVEVRETNDCDQEGTITITNEHTDIMEECSSSEVQQASLLILAAAQELAMASAKEETANLIASNRQEEVYDEQTILVNHLKRDYDHAVLGEQTIIEEAHIVCEPQIVEFISSEEMVETTSIMVDTHQVEQII